MSRRALIASGALAGAGAVAARLFGWPWGGAQPAAAGADRAAAPAAGTPGSCAVTPAQTAGPFYPTADQPDEDLDLTRIAGHAESARGEVIWVRGRIVDEECNPIPDALVEIWQANTHGRYHHERDTSPAASDPHFQGWGEVVTSESGEYGFKTIVPGPYGPPGGQRTRHIHFRVARRGYRELITQMYFEGEPLNARDALWNELSPEERSRVTVRKETMAGENGEEQCVCRFDVALRKV